MLARVVQVLLMHTSVVVHRRLIFEDCWLTLSRLLVIQVTLVCDDALLNAYFQIMILTISMLRRSFRWKDLTI